jgi:hypothetical protein
MRWSILRLAILCGVLLALLAECRARANDDLQYKFKLGDSFRYETEYKMRVTVEGNAIRFEFRYDANWTVTAVDADGNAKLTQKIGRVRLFGSDPESEVRFDSQEAVASTGQQGQKGGPFNSFLSAFPGSEFTMNVDRHGAVSDLTIPKKVQEGLKDLRGAPGTGETSAAEGFRLLLSRPIQPLPTGAIAKGSSWNQPTEFRMRSGQMKIEVAYTDDGPETRDGKRMERISVKPTLTIGKGRIAAKVTIKSQKAKGFFLFDRETGRVVEYNLTHDVEQEVPYGMGTEVQPVHSTWTVRQLDKEK